MRLGVGPPNAVVPWCCALTEHPPSGVGIENTTVDRESLLLTESLDSLRLPKWDPVVLVPKRVAPPTHPSDLVTSEAPSLAAPALTEAHGLASLRRCDNFFYLRWSTAVWLGWKAVLRVVGLRMSFWLVETD